MKLGIMQPYFLPYIGYFQLINAVDKFILYDDVNYIKQGWINRNNILLNSKKHLFTLELKGASSYKNINTIEIGNNRNKIFKTIIQAYKKAPYFIEIEPLLQDIFDYQNKNLSKFIFNSFEIINNYLEITTPISLSSDECFNKDLKSQDRIIDICLKQKADTYINAIGGQNLYSRNTFKKNGVELLFIESNSFEYKQFNENFIPHLSIIDVLMFNSKEKINSYLNAFKLI